MPLVKAIKHRDEHVTLGARLPLHIFKSIRLGWNSAGG